MANEAERMAERTTEQMMTDLASIPTVISGQFLADECGVEVVLSVRKYSRDTTAKATLVWQSGGAESLVETVPEIKFSCMSPDGRVRLVGRGEKANGDKTAKHVIEVWREGVYTASVAASVAGTRLHGDFCMDGIADADGVNAHPRIADVFGPGSWSPTGRQFVYVAEEWRDEATSHDKYVATESFGERLQSVKRPVLCCLHVDRLEIRTFPLASGESLVPAQPVFGTEETLYFVGIRLGARKLGMTYIYCRHSAICRAKFDFASDAALVPEMVSDESMSSRSPVASRCGRRICYLRNSVGRSHFKGSQLMLFDETTGETRVLVDTVDDLRGGFPGIYAQRIAPQRFESAVLLSTCWQDHRHVVKVNVATGKVERVVAGFEGSLRMLDARDGRYLLVGSTAIHPGRLFVYDGESGEVEELAIGPIERHPAIAAMRTTLCSQIVELNAQVHAVVLRPRGIQKTPLLLVPHGGPNSVYSVDYVLYPAVLAMLGYAVASVNYTGSIGFGDWSIADLEGQIGVRDVEDCQLCLEMLLRSGDYDESRVWVMGGSHGGYLAAFLSARCPTVFRGAILRNPVIDLPSMTITSDIGDWTFGQLGVGYDQLQMRSASEAELRLFRERSPSAYATNVECPTLVMLGAQDLRVPPSQGQHWAALLRGRGVDCTVYMFPDANHGLETAESERFGLQAIIAFLGRTECA